MGDKVVNFDSMNNDYGAVNSSSNNCGLLDSNNLMNYTSNTASPFYIGGQDDCNTTNPMGCSSFNTFCNPASPWYQNNKRSDNGSSNNTHQIHLTKKEKKVIKRTVFTLLAISTIVTLLFGLERGWEFFGSMLLLLLFGVLIPYIFILKDIYLSIKKKRNQKKHKQLELPL